MTKYQVYHDHGLLPWVIEADYFEPGVVLISPGIPARSWRSDEKPTPPTHINDGVLRLYANGSRAPIAAFPPGEWVHVRKVEETDA